MASPATRHESRFRRGRLILLTKAADEKPPKLSKTAEAMLVGLVQVEGWQLMRARLNARALKAKAEKLRQKFLDQFPPGLYGVIVTAKKRDIQVLMARQRLRIITDNGAFLDYLGEHAAEVVKSIQLPLSARLSDAASYARLVELLREEFGEETVAGLGIQFDSEALKELVDAELLDSPDEFFEHTDDGPIQVRVSLV